MSVFVPQEGNLYWCFDKHDRKWKPGLAVAKTGEGRWFFMVLNMHDGAIYLENGKGNINLGEQIIKPRHYS